MKRYIILIMVVICFFLILGTMRWYLATKNEDSYVKSEDSELERAVLRSKGYLVGTEENNFQSVEGGQKALSLHLKVKASLGITEEGKTRYMRTYKEDFEGRDVLVVYEKGIAETKINRATGELICFFNQKSRNSFRKWQKEIGDRPVKATRTEKEIIALGDQYLEKLTGKPRSANLELETRYFETNIAMSKGEWSLIYWRTLNGYKYQHDLISIGIHDTSGQLLGFARSLTSGTCPTEIKITEEEAKRKAIKTAVKYSPEAFDVFKVKNPRIESVEFRIVNPNYFLTPKMYLPNYYPLAITSNVRLSYFVTVAFDATVIHEKSATATSFIKKIFVWIDTITGDVLGGDMM